MSDPVLSIRGLSRTYKSGDKILTVLNGVDLDVQPGEIVGLIGPSGSGKSSLLHAAGLLEHPDAGKIIIEGRDCSDLSDRQRTRVRLATIGFVYQAHHLLADEPTGNLDPNTSGAVFESLYELARSQGVAALVATHNLDLARHMDRVVALKDGHLERQIL